VPSPWVTEATHARIHLQHLAKLILAIDLSDELVLDVRPYGVDHEVHDRLGHSVLQILTDDLEVGDEKRSDDVRLELGARGLNTRGKGLKA
jgi:hypothetical protein